MVDIKTHLASINPPVALTGNLRRWSRSRLKKPDEHHMSDFPNVVANLWKETPISVRKASLFLPLIHCTATSLTFSSISQQASQGSVLTRANERSSFRGLKSFFFCFES